MRSGHSSLKELAKALSELERSTLALSQTSHTVNRLVKEVERTLITSSENMEKDIEKLSEISLNFQSFMKDFQPIVEELSKTSKEYGRLIENLNKINNQLFNIESIASHIELVAINASIEASRAGENGRTFAIVANEIRDMAKKTFRILHEIQRLESEINPILDAVKGNIEAMNQVKNRLDSLVEDIDRVIKISEELRAVNQKQREVIVELKGLSGVATALERVFQVLNRGKEFLSKAFHRVSRL
jgi:methyl-accepting chemotaxis protein